MINLIKKAEETHTLSRDEICRLLNDTNIQDELFQAADRVRKKYVGDEVYLRALIEFSNTCSRHCAYCGLRCENQKVQRYNLTTEQITNIAKNAINLGFKTLVLQSGESSTYSEKEMCELIKKLKEFDVAITLSTGEKTTEEYKAYKEAGADRFLLRIETTDKALYEKMHPYMSFENRKRCLHDLKELGFETGTGVLVGLPSQSIESLANDILFFKELNADMIGIGPLISHSETPLATVTNGDFWLALRVMALTRLLLPKINIPATTAMETLHQNGRIIALQSGANVVMPNFTDETVRSKYDIYPDKDAPKTTMDRYLKDLTCKMHSIGRNIKMSRGDSRNFGS